MWEISIHCAYQLYTTLLFHANYARSKDLQVLFYPIVCDNRHIQPTLNEKYFYFAYNYIRSVKRLDLHIIKTISMIRSINLLQLNIAEVLDSSETLKNNFTL